VAPAAPAAALKPGDQVTAPPATLSVWSQEIQRLVQAGVDARVVLSYLTNSAGIFNLTADHLIYLKGAGVPPQILSAMIQHDQQLFPGAEPLTKSPPATTTLIATPATPGAAPIVAAEDSPALEPPVSDVPYYAPEQREDLGPVRAPYAVRLNDPIIMLRLPTFTVPCW
jgi:hypothetical protein